MQLDLGTKIIHTWIFLKGYSFGLLQSETLTSAFIVGSLGAFFGAVGAHTSSLLSERHRINLEILSELSRATFLAHSISAYFAALKDQHIYELYGRYNFDRARLAHFQNAKQNGSIFEVHYHLQTLPPIDLRSESLLRIINSIPIQLPRQTLSAQLLVSTERDLAIYSEQRNEWIKNFRELDLPSNQLVNLYFGKRVSDELHDTSYSDIIGAIFEKCDDAIGFAHALSVDLEERAWEFRKSKFSRFRRVPVPVISPNEMHKAMIPDLSHVKLALQGKVLPRKRIWESWDRYRERIERFKEGG